ncbi:hypothetical protein BKA93DRAFT_758452 [Sparassis latifolia]|uniref:Uncharacterized protein n=1 Tax=Sparassis crispa TaxID=139825 RepID=A0A401GC73_9APHY|nr:hypothetical protein SCP_0209240 [Sparassis crispa]GBE79723.1 hypothetical protein SCP_0209240 [Sparassis crispa]
MSSPVPSSSGHTEPHIAQSPPPDINLRSRLPESVPGDVSPTSSTFTNMSRTPGGPILSAHLAGPTRKITIRADPSLVTCFDPSDKQVYDLWAPKK